MPREENKQEENKENDYLHDLDIQQRDILLNFRDITQLHDLNLCRSILYQNNWNLEIAIENFIHGRDIVENSHHSSPLLSTSGSVNHNTTTLTNRNNSHSNQDQNNQTTIFDFIISPLRWIFRIYPESLNPDEDASHFISEFQKEYGDNGPQFQGVSYSQVVSNANRESKFLLIYLHSPLHDDTSKFCR